MPTRRFGQVIERITHFDRTTLVTDIASRAAAYGIAGSTVDGMDLLAVHGKAGELIESARNGAGASLLECRTYRYTGHSRFEPANYRTKEEVEEWKLKDPLVTFRAWMESHKATREQIAATEKEVEGEIAAAVSYAEASPAPDPVGYEKYIFA